MRRLLIHTSVLMMLAVGQAAWAQRGGGPSPSQSALAEDWKPCSTNLIGQQYPQVNSARQVRFRITARDVTSITVLNTKLDKDANGVFTGISGPQDPGFHYYQLTVDGLQVADPSSESFYGANWIHSGIEIPEAGVDFYDIKDVPHGDIHTHYYKTKAGDNRLAYVYTPPEYDKDPTKKYPVLYLQHGMGEDRRAWPNQGRTNFILDNLIAEKKAVPMIIVMEDGGIATGMSGNGGILRSDGAGRGAAPAGRGAVPAAGGAMGPVFGEGQMSYVGAPAGPGGGGGMGGRAGGGGGMGGMGGMGGGMGGRGGAGMGGGMPFVTMIINDVIPEIDAKFRTLADRDHRAMAGLSLGGTQTYQITSANKDKFAYVGIFSAPFGFPGLNSYAPSAAEFDKQYKVFFVSMGSKEGASSGRDPAQQLKTAGVKNVTYYEAPGTAHEFQTWRRSLNEFAPLLFKD